MANPKPEQMREELKQFCTDHICTPPGELNCPIYDFSNKNPANDTLYFCHFHLDNYTEKNIKHAYNLMKTAKKK